MHTTDQRTQELLEQILIWTRASSFSNVEAMLKKALPADKDRNAYQAMDPDAEKRKSRDEIKKELQMGSDTLNDLVKRCLSMGLMKREGANTVRLFDLGDFGMLPDPPKATEKKAKNG